MLDRTKACGSERARVQTNLEAVARAIHVDGDAREVSVRVRRLRAALRMMVYVAPDPRYTAEVVVLLTTLMSKRSSCHRSRRYLMRASTG